MGNSTLITFAAKYFVAIFAHLCLYVKCKSYVVMYFHAPFAFGLYLFVIISIMRIKKER